MWFDMSWISELRRNGWALELDEIIRKKRSWDPELMTISNPGRRVSTCFVEYFYYKTTCVI